MPWMFGRLKGAPTKEKIKNQNTISDEQCSPLQGNSPNKNHSLFTINYSPFNATNRSHSGITLIALIITIILLLILAGVTINFTLGENGILKNAEIAANKYKQAGENEADLLDEIDAYIDGDRNYPENTPETSAGERVVMPDGWYR